MIRIGSSWKITPISSFGYVDEVRRHWFPKPEWDYRGAAKQCLDNDSYLIFNQCLGYNKTQPHPEYLPTESEWKNRAEENIQMLYSIGANRNNTMLTLINEPTKYFRVENGYGGVNDLIKYTNWLYEQVNGRFDIGAGNSDFYSAMVLGDWLRYLCRDGKFKYLLVHIQNDCNTEAHTRKYLEYAKGLSIKYKKVLSCSEAMHTGWDMSKLSDYNKLVMQLNLAEEYGLKDFCVICTDLNTQAANQELGVASVKKLYPACFKINGILKSNYYAQLKILANKKHPVPNIPIIEEEDMKLEKYYYRLKVTYNRDKTKAGIKFIQTVIEVEPDGKWGDATDNALETYQITNGLAPDKIVGPLTFREMMKTDSNAYIDLQYFLAVGDW